MFRHPCHQPLGKIDARHFAFQGAAQNLGGVDHTDAVGQHQVSPQQGLLEFGVFPGGQDKFRVGGHSIVKAVRFHQPGASLYRLIQRQVVEADAQNICPQNELPPIGSSP